MSGAAKAKSRNCTPPASEVDEKALTAEDEKTSTRNIRVVQPKTVLRTMTHEFICRRIKKTRAEDKKCHAKTMMSRQTRLYSGL